MARVRVLTTRQFDCMLAQCLSDAGITTSPYDAIGAIQEGVRKIFALSKCSDFVIIRENITNTIFKIDIISGTSHSSDKPVVCLQSVRLISETCPTPDINIQLMPAKL